MTTRLRIAPSPTGSMHVGTGRTALFNWLFARHTGGTFIVRIDDTDDERSDPLLRGRHPRWPALARTALGRGRRGRWTARHLPRSQRPARSLSRKLARSAGGLGARLLRRSIARGAGGTSGNRHRARAGTRATTSVVPTANRERGRHPTVDPAGQPRVEFERLVRDQVRLSFARADIDDFVILRSNGIPTYHLASTVDDVDYEITHVARGEDLLPSTPKHILLTRAMGAAEARSTPTSRSSSGPTGRSCPSGTVRRR